MRRKDDIGVLSGFTQIDPVLDKDEHRGLLTVPELVDLIKPIQQDFEQLAYVKKLLEEHIQTATKSTSSPSDYNLTYVLYREYVDKFHYLGSFENFVSQMYDQLDLANISDLTDPVNNSRKLATLEVLMNLVLTHDTDPTAHKVIEQTLFTGQLFDIIPRIKMDVASNKEMFIGTVPPVSGLNLINTGGIIDPSAQGAIDYTRYDTPMCMISQVKSNMSSGTTGLSGVTDVTALVINDHDYIDLTKNFLAISETATDAVHKVIIPISVAPYNLTVNNYVTASFDFKPLDRTMLNISTSRFSVNVAVGSTFSTFEKSNTTGHPVIVRVEQVGFGFKRVSVSWVNVGSESAINVSSIKAIQGDTQFVGDNTKIIGLISKAQLEIGGYPTPRLLSSVTRAANNFSLPISNFRNFLQGTLFMEFLKTRSRTASTVVVMNMSDFFVKVSQIDGSVTVTVTDNRLVRTYTRTQLVTEETLIRVAISFGTGGAVIGVNSDITVHGDITDMTTIPELDVIVRDPNIITIEEFQSLQQFPVVKTTLLNDPEGTVEQIIDTVIPYLSVERDANNDIKVVDSSLAGYRKEIVGVGTPPSSTDKLYVGYDPTTDKYADVMFTRLLLFDIAANTDQVAYLTNKYTSMFRHRF